MSRRDGLASGVADGLGIAVAGLTVVGVLAVAAAARSAGTIDGVLVATLGLLCLASFDAVSPLPEAARQLSATLAAGRRVLDITDREPLVRDPAGAARVPSARPTFALDGVGARYAPGEPLVLDGVSFELAPGRRLALVGPSGAGKTTIVNLLLRFLDPSCGRVTLDGHDLRDYRQEDVRRAIAVAGQDFHLFTTTIRENVRLARPGATDAELEDALRRARIWDWVATLPEGMGTMVGEEGTWLSGGQRQRIGLARALLADAPVLVLDEPTAHLDPRDRHGAPGRRPRRARRQEPPADHAPVGRARADGRDPRARRRPGYGGLIPQALRNEAPGSRRTRPSPVRNAFGGHVIGSTARLRRLTSASGSPVKSMR